MAASSPSEIVAKHVEAAMREASAAGIDTDAVGRTLLDQAVAILQRGHSADEVAQELRFIADNLGDEEEYAFMRP